MRLLDTRSLALRSFSGDFIPPYAILSHTWYDAGEVEYRHLSKRGKLKGFDKVLQSARIAESYGYQYVWIDACCIDKSSSAEHEESINSMYKWYQGASMCIIYLEDLDFRAEPNPRSARKVFMHAKWFTRGWTLQELIASKGRVFFDARWENLNDIVGDDKLLRWVERRTAIPLSVLTGEVGLEKVNIATKMQWAAHRETTREEDTAYALVGIFDVHMSPHYGEGKVKAFIRLQRKILKSSSDHTIFAWSRPRHHTGQWTGLLAASPDWFDNPSTRLRGP
ncbi:HET-domain-containing protein [Thozetella sp. PMI_491]|nr:HET-domain-containing protein [Thozetella sp. PMI_491]